MRELALHVLDIIQNSLRAGAKLIRVEIIEDTVLDSLVITIEDNGCGMDSALAEKVVDPFTTTRTTRKVGLGIPLLKMAAERSGGEFSLSSKPGKGTMVKASFQYSHIDRMPLGNMADTILAVIIGNPAVDMIYCHRVNHRVWELDTRVLKAEVGEDGLTLPVVIEWLRSYLEQGNSYLMGVHE
ncbi:MAG: sensor histidine kinase [Firmicutes bacterium]|nr:sensor histidine kinase [Bacillota bacterium]